MIKKSKGASAEFWTYGSDQKNELLSAKDAATDGGTVDTEVDFRYDAYGNRIEKSYDDDGRLLPENWSKYYESQRAMKARRTLDEADPT